jgi:beta-N-acetylglucosaminidase
LKYFKEVNENEILEIYAKSIEKQNKIDFENLKEQMKEQAKKKKEDLKKKLAFYSEKHFEKVYTDEQFMELSAQIRKEVQEIDNLLAGSTNEIAAGKEQIDTAAAKEKLINL